MSPSYDRRQEAGSWPTKSPWKSGDLPPWYLELISGLTRDLTSFVDDHDPGQPLDPRHDPRRRRHIDARSRASR